MVPEPSSLVLIGTGVCVAAAVGLLRRRTRRPELAVVTARSADGTTRIGNGRALLQGLSPTRDNSPGQSSATNLATSPATIATAVVIEKNRPGVGMAREALHRPDVAVGLVEGAGDRLVSEPVGSDRFRETRLAAGQSKRDPSSPQSMTAFIFKEPNLVVLMFLAEGDDGLIGDFRSEVHPGETAFGLTLTPRSGVSERRSAGRWIPCNVPGGLPGLCRFCRS